MEGESYRQELNELGDGDVSDEGDFLTVEENAIVDQRLAEHDANPQSAISWTEFEARMDKKFGNR